MYVNMRKKIFWTSLKQESDLVKQESDLVKQESDLVKQESDLVKQESDLVKQEWTQFSHDSSIFKIDILKIFSADFFCRFRFRICDFFLQPLNLKNN